MSDKIASGNRLANLLIMHEGLRLTPYRCTAGKLTIGVGRNLEDKGISRNEAFYLLHNDLQECERDLRRIFPNWDSLSDVRKACLIDMRFNLGYRGFRSFKRFITAVREGDYERASKEMLDSRWASQVKHRAIDLSQMMLNDEWPEGV